MFSRSFPILLCFFALVSIDLVDGQVRVDADLPHYHFSDRRIAGKLRMVGSETMNGLILHWAEKFQAGFPGVHFEIDGTGSAKAIPALISGADFGPMSREWNGAELRAFEDRYGYQPTLLPVCIDLLVIYVHRENPLRSITMDQLDAIFSATRRSGAPRAIDRWEQLGVELPHSYSRIEPFGRNGASGTYGFFKEKILRHGDFRSSVSEQPGTNSVIQAVGSIRNAIGYGGLRSSSSTRVLAVAEKKGDEPVLPEQELVARGTYPLARTFYLAFHFDPRSKELDPLRKEFIRFALSREGQEIATLGGYLPIAADQARKRLANLGIGIDEE